MKKNKEIQEPNLTLPYFLSENNFRKLADLLHVPNITSQARSQINEVVKDYSENMDFLWNNPIPCEAKVRAKLVGVRDSAKKLINCLEELDEKSQQMLWIAGYYVGEFRDKNEKAPVLIEGNETQKMNRAQIGRISRNERATALQKRIAKQVLNKWQAKGKDENEDLFRKPDVYILFSAAEKALKIGKKDKGGRPKEKASLRKFILDLKPIFEEITKKKATVNWDPYKSKYGSHFYDFIYECLSIIYQKDLLSKGIWSDIALGQQIKKVLSSSKSIPHS